MFRDASQKFRKGRLIVLVILILLSWIALEVNLFRLQVTKHEMFKRVAENQYTKKIKLPPRRGSIYDRNGFIMATNVLHYDLAADPRMVQNKNQLARKCADVLGKSYQHYMKLLNTNSNFVYLDRRLREDEISDILVFNDAGLIKAKNFRRAYPYKHYAAHLLGFTDTDDHGISGLELKYNDIMQGESGEAFLQYDAPRRISYNPDQPIRWPKDGTNIVLTIDKNIQTIVEQELEKGIRQAQGKGGMAVVMDPFTGEILAMANYPSFDPNKQHLFHNDQKRNRVVADVFEPGSTLKIFSAAALLQENKKSPQDIVYCEQGSYVLSGSRFSDTRKYGWLPLNRVIANSSNVGMIKLVNDLTGSLLHKYLLHFGFGSLGGINLVGEVAGSIKNPANWSGISKYSMAIGYEIGVTAIQLTAAYAAAINGGNLYKPYVIRYFEDADGRAYNFNKPQWIREVISRPVSEALKEMMLLVVDEGTGTRARIPGLKVGGKTGTARKLDPTTKKYSTSRYLSSFVGFAPFEQPKYLITVIIDEPTTFKYGGEVAAPIFRDIMYRIIHLNKDDLGTESEENFQYPQLVQINELPDLIGFQADNAIALLDAKNIKYKLSGSGPHVVNIGMEKKRVLLERGYDEIEMERMPRLIGLALREALTQIDLSKCKVQIEGQGVVTRQSIAPGTAINGQKQLIITCN